VVPLLLAHWRGASRALARTASHAAEAQRLLDVLARADCESAAIGAALSAQRLRALSADRRRNALRFWIQRSGHPVPDAARLTELAGPVLRARADSRPQVRWGNSVIERHGALLQLCSAPALAALDSLPWRPHIHPTLHLPPGLGSLELARAA